MSSNAFAAAALAAASAIGWAQPPAAPDLAARGAYVAVLGDCVACHTGPGGAPMAGGLGLRTPFGVLYSTNITPDAQTGLGRVSFEQFDRAMRLGVAADGHNLYPAMPYPSYAKMTAEDMRALYAFLTQRVAPVHRANKAPELSWPFSMRWTLSLWNAAFLDATPFVADASRDASWNRGAYLAQGPGHCGACHTPRGIGFQEKAGGDAGGSGHAYLAGETIEAWRAPSLRNLWTVEDTVAMLKTGRNRFGAVSGSMVDVIHHSTQHFAGGDLAALATYLKSLPPGDREVPMPVFAPATPVPGELFTTAGGLGYAQFCMDCHRQHGLGVQDLFPPLTANPTVAARDPATLIHLMLTGWKTAQTQAHPRVAAMPSFAGLEDGEIAAILTFMRGSWGHRADGVGAPDVERMRLALRVPPGRSSFATPRMAAMLQEPNAAQLVRGMRLHLQTGALLPQHVGNDLNCTSCHLNAGTVADGSPFVGVAAFFPGYAARAGRVITLEDRINGCFLRSMNGKPLPADSSDMRAMVAYFRWMQGATKPQDQVPGRGVGKIDPRIKPDPANGRKVYEEQCATCHGRDGEGLRQAGSALYPPLWGEQSFNIGAGMARTYTAAAFVKRNMPIGITAKFPLGQGGGLSDQEAVDVAEYFSHQPRPDFAGKVKDWPNDPKPADARY